MKILYKICLFSPFFLNFFKDELTIKLEYVGDIDKPIPGVVFFVDEYKLAQSEYADTFRISQIEFNSLKECVESNHKLLKSHNCNYYKITVLDGALKEQLCIKNKKNAVKIFNKFIEKLSHSKQGVEIKTKLVAILSRM